MALYVAPENKAEIFVYCTDIERRLDGCVGDCGLEPLVRDSDIGTGSSRASFRCISTVVYGLSASKNCV